MKKFGLIGFPLGHSFSKKFFSEKFERESIDARYDLYELPEILAFKPLMDIDGLCGLNVTIPYKQQVMQYLNELDETAAEIGAVNVIKFIRRDDKLLLTVGFLLPLSMVHCKNKFLLLLKNQPQHQQSGH
jgi:shikimate dehydrogenase